MQRAETPDGPEHEDHIKNQAYNGQADVIGSWNDQNAARCLDILTNILGIWAKINATAVRCCKNPGTVKNTNPCLQILQPQLRGESKNSFRNTK